MPDPTPTPAPASTATLPGIEAGALHDWFAREVGDVGALSFTQVEGGHSCLTFLVDTEAGERFVLRRPPVGHVLATAHDVLREHRIISAIADTEVPVAPVVGACADTEVTGAPFYVMRFVDGVVLHDRAASETLPPEARRRAGESMIDVLVALQDVDPDAVGLGDFAKRTDYLGRQLKRWHRQWEAAETRPLPRMTELHDWLVAHQPDEGPAGIVHGDFRLGNAIHAPDGSVAALLDWELCTLGPREADLAYLLRSWGPSPAASAAEGFPTAEELVDRYQERSSRAAAHLDYWTAFHAWRSACIVAGVYTRYAAGQMGRDGDFSHFELAVEEGMTAGLRAAGIE